MVSVGVRGKVSRWLRSPRVGRVLASRVRRRHGRSAAVRLVVMFVIVARLLAMLLLLLLLLHVTAVVPLWLLLLVEGTLAAVYTQPSSLSYFALHLVVRSDAVLLAV